MRERSDVIEEHSDLGFRSLRCHRKEVRVLSENKRKRGRPRTGRVKCFQHLARFDYDDECKLQDLLGKYGQSFEQFVHDVIIETWNIEFR